MRDNFVSKNSKLMEEWCWEKNNALNLFPDKLTCGSSKKVWWKCKKCGYEWKTKISHRNNGTGCKKCLHTGLSTAEKGKDLETLYPDIVKEWNYDKNDVSPSIVYPNSNKKYWWKCSLGHEWLDNVNHRVSRKSGCPYCSNHRVLEGYNDLVTTHPKLIQEWDWEKNKNFNIYPNLISSGCHKKVGWVCEKGHKWESVVYSRTTNRRGCPYCAQEFQTSFPEKTISFYISKVFSDCIENYKSQTLGRRELDIFIPSINVAIEYDGAKWHQSVKNDLEKDNNCLNNGIKIIRIREIGCPIYESKSEKIYLKGKDNKELETAIRKTFDIISRYLKIEIDLDICIERDSVKIIEKLLTVDKEKSILNSNLIKEWDFKKNRDLNPKFVSCYSNKKVWWRCSKCNYSWRTAVAHRIEGKGCPVCGREKTISSHFKSVVCLETNIFYNSVKEAGEKNKINPSSISNCCRGVSKTAGGYHWKYVDKEKD